MDYAEKTWPAKPEGHSKITWFLKTVNITGGEKERPIHRPEKTKETWQLNAIWYLAQEQKEGTKFGV